MGRKCCMNKYVLAIKYKSMFEKKSNKCDRTKCVVRSYFVLSMTVWNLDDATLLSCEKVFPTLFENTSILNADDGRESCQLGAGILRFFHIKYDVKSQIYINICVSAIINNAG